jgi:UDP-3-O-[3-hydroxymyristoyl] glucosamine N-acyltransferase
MAVTLGDLAAQFECRLTGDADTVIDRVATLSTAGPGSISFFANALFREQLRTTRASAVILAEEAAADCPVAALVAANPYATYARIAAAIVPPRRVAPGIHASASIAATAKVAPTAEVGALAVIGDDAQIGERALIGPGAVVGAGVVVGADTRIGPNVTLVDGVSLGERCILHPGAVIGADGFGFALDRGTWVKVPQLGTVIIGNDVEIGANTTIDRGTIEPTVIEDGVKLDNLVQIAHNVRVGAHTVMAAMSGAAGSTKIGRRCMFGGGAVTINHLEICDDVLITFRSIVTKSITTAGTYSGSLPAAEAAQWRRNVARFRSLDKFAARLRAVENAIRQFTGKSMRDENE